MDDLKQFFDSTHVETIGGTSHLLLVDSQSKTETPVKLGSCGSSSSARDGITVYVKDASGSTFYYRGKFQDKAAANAFTNDLLDDAKKCDEANNRVR